MLRILLLLFTIIPYNAFASMSPSGELYVLTQAVNKIEQEDNHPLAGVKQFLLSGISEREQFISERLGDSSTYVIVNIGSQRLTALRDNDIVLSQKVIIGRNSRPTPIFSDSIRHIVTNPYWNVPTFIARADVIPKILSDNSIKDEYGYEMIDNESGEVVEFDTIADLRKFRIRQLPGPLNALGDINFVFNPVPNRLVYLHDTPDRTLFEYVSGRYSSGSIRLEDSRAFAQYLMNGEFLTMSKVVDRWLKLEEPVDVHVVDWNVYIDEDGDIIVNSPRGDKFMSINSIVSHITRH